MANKESYEVVKKSSIKKVTTAQMALVAVCVIGLVYVVFKVTSISNKLSTMTISDQKVGYVYDKVGELVKILDTREDFGGEYNPAERYDFKPEADVLTSESPLTAEENREALKEELRNMNSGEKLKLVRNKLVDVFQTSKTRNEELTQVKQMFYDVKTLVEHWYNDRKGIKQSDRGADQAGFVDRLKKNLGNFVEINKVGTDLSAGGGRVLSADQVPQMLSYAEILLEAGSTSQAVWVMQDVQTITRQEEIGAFTERAEKYLEKYPNPNADIQGIKELIDIIEEQG